CVEQDDKGRDARKRAYCLKIQPATGSFARNLIYSTKPVHNKKTAAHRMQEQAAAGCSVFMPSYRSVFYFKCILLSLFSICLVFHSE
ncbi:hypothetical protein, partial [Enterobacter asburiae]|uniref:hypothetical protein n=1 Tax=Enterobacter asburiae TaxID=61645 RepID=UPI001BCF6DAA